LRGASVGATGPQLPDMAAAANSLVAQGKLDPALTALGASEAFTKDLKAKSELAKVDTENLDKQLATFRTFAGQVRSPEDAGVYAQAMFDHPVIGKLMAQTGYSKEAAVAKAQQDFAADPQRWIAGHIGLTGEQIMKSLQPQPKPVAAAPAQAPMTNPITSAAFNAGGASPVQLAMLGGVGASPLLQMTRPMPSEGGVLAPTRVASRTRKPAPEVEPEVLATEDEGPPLPKLTPAQELKLRDQVAKDYEKAVAGIAGASGVLEAAGKVRTAKGLSGATGIVGLFPSAPDSAAAIAENRIKNLTGKVTLMGKSSASATGAIGSIANQEWKILRDMVASLDTFKGEKALREQIEEIENPARGAESRIRDAYEKHHEQTVRRPAFKTYKNLPELKTFAEPEEQKKPARRGTLTPAPQPTLPAGVTSSGW